MILHVSDVAPTLSIVKIEDNGKSLGTYVIDVATRTAPVAYSRWVEEQGGVRPFGGWRADDAR